MLIASCLALGLPAMGRNRAFVFFFSQRVRRNSGEAGPSSRERECVRITAKWRGLYTSSSRHIVAVDGGQMTRANDDVVGLRTVFF